MCVNGASAKILMSPVAHVAQSEQVLLAWPNEKEISKEAQKELQDTLAAIQTVNKAS